jgi:hypothetical protein
LANKAAKDLVLVRQRAQLSQSGAFAFRLRKFQRFVQPDLFRDRLAISSSTEPNPSSRTISAISTSLDPRCLGRNSSVGERDISVKLDELALWCMERRRLIRAERVAKRICDRGGTIRINRDPATSATEAGQIRKRGLPRRAKSTVAATRSRIATIEGIALHRVFPLENARTSH